MMAKIHVTIDGISHDYFFQVVSDLGLWDDMVEQAQNLMLKAGFKLFKNDHKLQLWLNAMLEQLTADEIHTFLFQLNEEVRND
jgi:hypothetical protein